MGSMMMLGAGPSGPGAAGPVTLLEDTFSDANGTALTSHTMDVGPGWTKGRANGFTIDTNKAKMTPSESTDWADAGEANVTASVDLTISGAPPNSALVVNLTDLQNNWLLFAVAGAVAIYEKTANAYTLRATAAQTWTSSQTYALRLVTNGDAITGYVDGVQKVTYSVGNRPHKTAAKCGLESFAADDRFDNFLVTL